LFLSSYRKRARAVKLDRSRSEGKRRLDRFEERELALGSRGGQKTLKGSGFKCTGICLRCRSREKGSTQLDKGETST